MDFRIKELLKEKGFLLGDLSDKLNIHYTAFHKKINKPTFKTLEELEELTGIKAIEFITPPAGFKHLYTPAGEWLGIVPEHGNDTRPLYMEDNGSFTLIGSITPDKVKKP